MVLAFGTWLIYVADRILDGLDNQPDYNLTARHGFYRKNRRQMFPWIGAILAATLWLSAERLPRPVLVGNVLLSVVVIAYFGVVHAAPKPIQQYWPKELIVALLFAAGTTVLTWTGRSSIGVGFGLAFALFAATLWVNALEIECWERATNRAARARLRPWITRSLALHLGPAAAVIGAIAACCASSTLAGAWPVYTATALSAFSLAGLEWLRDRMAPDLLHFFADIALLTPIFFLPFLTKT